MEGGMRTLKAATIIMGILILVGTAVLVAVIIKRSTSPETAAGPQNAGLVPSGSAPYALAVQAPPGGRISGVSAVGSLLAISISGPQDEVVVVDPATGRTVGSITLAHN